MSQKFFNPLNPPRLNYSTAPPYLIMLWKNKVESVPHSICYNSFHIAYINHIFKIAFFITGDRLMMLCLKIIFFALDFLLRLKNPSLLSCLAWLICTPDIGQVAHQTERSLIRFFTFFGKNHYLATFANIFGPVA